MQYDLPLGWLASILFTGVVALYTLIFGRRTSRQADWAVAFALFVLLVAAIFGWVGLYENGLEPVVLMRGWIGRWSEPQAIRIGFLQDALGMTLGVVAALCGLIFTANRQFIGTEPRPERTYAAVALGVTGVAIAWTALTPWLVLVGLVTAVFGGFLSLGSRWSMDEREAAYASRFIREHAWGILMAVIGGAVLVTAKADLTLHRAGAWYPYPEIVGGAILLIVGMFMQFRPFPFLGWAAMPSATPVPMRALSAQIFIAWTAFSVPLRMEGQLRSIGVFPGFGWVALLAGILAIGSGLFQREWRKALSLWLSAAFCVAFAGITFAGPMTGLAILVSTSLGILGVALCGEVLEKGGGRGETHHKRALWAKIILFSAVAAATGCIGFLSATGGLRMLESIQGDPLHTVSVALVLFLMTFLGWKTAFTLAESRKSTDAGWGAVLTPVMFVLLPLGVFWTGTASGGVIHGAPDRLFVSLLDLFAPGRRVWVDDAAFFGASWFHWGAVVLGMTTAYSLRNSWTSVYSVAPGLVDFLGNAYGVDRVFAVVLRKFVSTGRVIENFLTSTLWERWLSANLNGLLRRTATGLSRMDAVATRVLDAGAARATGMPAKVLQLVQDGDLQWYLLFAVGSGVAILVHFF